MDKFTESYQQILNEKVVDIKKVGDAHDNNNIRVVLSVNDEIKKSGEVNELEFWVNANGHNFKIICNLLTGKFTQEKISHSNF